MRAGTTRRDWLAASALLALGALGAPRTVRAAPLDWPALTLLDGRRLEAADWRDTAAVIVFWATWCPFCHRHNAHVEKLHRATAGRALRVLGVALDRDPQVVVRHMAAQGWTFPVTLQSEPLRALAGTRRVTPVTVPVTRGGEVLAPIPGEMFEEDVLELARLAQPA